LRSCGKKPQALFCANSLNHKERAAEQLLSRGRRRQRQLPVSPDEILPEAVLGAVPPSPA